MRMPPTLPLPARLLGAAVASGAPARIDQPRRPPRAAPGAAAAASTTTARPRLHRRRPPTCDIRMASALTARATTTRFGTSFSGAVIDATSNATIWRKNGDTAYKPASTNKLVTASNALTLCGPDKRWFTTRVRQGRPPTGSSCQGSGDPASAAPTSTRWRATTATVAARPRITRPGLRRRRRLPDAAPRLRVEGELRARLDRPDARPWCATSARTPTPAPRRPATSVTGSRPTA